MRRFSLLLPCVVATMLCLSPAWGAGDPAARCAAAKIKAAGKRLAAAAKCHSRAAERGVAVDLSCLGRAEQMFEAAFAKAEARAGCVTTGDAGAVGSLVDTCIQSVVEALPATTSTTSSSTTSTTLFLPACSTQFGPCGSCGNGICGFHVDPNPPALICLDLDSPGGSPSCDEDADCPFGQICGSLSVGGGCGFACF